MTIPDPRGPLANTLTQRDKLKKSVYGFITNFKPEEGRLEKILKAAELAGVGVMVLVEATDIWGCSIADQGYKSVWLTDPSEPGVKAFWIAFAKLTQEEREAQLKELTEQVKLGDQNG